MRLLTTHCLPLLIAACFAVSTSLVRADETFGHTAVILVIPEFSGIGTIGADIDFQDALSLESLLPVGGGAPCQIVTTCTTGSLGNGGGALGGMPLGDLANSAFNQMFAGGGGAGGGGSGGGGGGGGGSSNQFASSLIPPTQGAGDPLELNPGGGSYDPGYNGSNDIAVAPEPMSLAIWAVMAVAVCFWRRRAA